jgi:hypothetical protein
MAGEVALLSGIPLLPIGAFGGASSELLQNAMAVAKDQARRSELGKLFGPWGDEVRRTVAGLLSVVGVAVIHGHGDAWRAVRDLVNGFASADRGYRALLMREEILGSESLPVKWESVAATAHAAIAVLTPDDLGGLADASGSPNPRARQNVWLEIGWTWGSLGRKRLMLLVRGDVEIPSDFAGIETYRYADDPGERAKEIERFLASIS